jgi:hypothetical protein
VLHGYCIRGRGDPEPDAVVEGLGGGGILRIEEGDLVLWCSELDARPAVTIDHLKAHDNVVRAALRVATPLPLRFGTAFDDEAAARAMLRERSEEFGAALERVAGRVEMGIRVSAAEGFEAVPEPRSEPRPKARSGREFLEIRRRELDAAASMKAAAGAALDRVESGLVDLALPSHREILPREGVLGLVAHLVHRGDLGLYRQRVAALRDDLPELVLVPSGPWAPYSFV